MFLADGAARVICEVSSSESDIVVLGWVDRVEDKKDKIPKNGIHVRLT